MLCSQRSAVGRLLNYDVLRYSSCIGQFVRYQSSTSKSTVGVESTNDIPELMTDGDYEKAVANTQDGSLAVFQFTASWCGPCQAIKPQVINFSKQYPKVQFFKLDVDNGQLQKTLIDNQISAVPTFIFMKSKKIAAQLNGAQPDELLSILKTQSS
eukprot:TRINITY_DN2727_c0_g2_i2.p1 TRINITY_DN2727_c0_g2~~TRINITY_DN2727_c0_g2_i2.p1  ORF type:complete len:155 (-),score=18.04 TRINITY_DN2727_c0_g2_i2:230-694(-)